MEESKEFFASLLWFIPSLSYLLLYYLLLSVAVIGELCSVGFLVWGGLWGGCLCEGVVVLKGIVMGVVWGGITVRGWLVGNGFLWKATSWKWIIHKGNLCFEDCYVGVIGLKWVSTKGNNPPKTQRTWGWLGVATPHVFFWKLFFCVFFYGCFFSGGCFFCGGFLMDFFWWLLFFILS